VARPSRAGWPSRMPYRGKCGPAGGPPLLGASVARLAPHWRACIARALAGACGVGLCPWPARPRWSRPRAREGRCEIR
jgi:hypothetical protein